MARPFKEIIMAQKTCSSCGGSGKKEVYCSSCGGSGKASWSSNYTTTDDRCPQCHGTGRATESCSSCGGSGYVDDGRSESSSSSYDSSSSSSSYTPTRSGSTLAESVLIGQGFALRQQGRNDEAIAVYTKAISLNGSDLANAYFGRGVTYANNSQLPEATADFKKAADLGSKEALEFLSEANIKYTPGSGGSSSASADPVELLTQGYDAQDAGDYATAFRLFMQVADGGAYKAYCAAADVISEGGNGLQQDLKKAFELYLKGAERGDERAHNNLGYCYQHGEGVQKNLAKAKEWYQKSAAQGHQRAKEHLAELE